MVENFYQFWWHYKIKVFNNYVLIDKVVTKLQLQLEVTAMHDSNLHKRHIKINVYFSVLLRTRKVSLYVFLVQLRCFRSKEREK